MYKLDFARSDFKNLVKASVLVSDKYNKRTCDKIMMKNIKVLDKIYFQKGIKNNFISRGFRLSKVFVNSLKAMYFDYVETEQKRESVHELFNIPKEEITGDFTKFIESSGEFKAYVNDFQYDATTPKENIKNIQIFYGNLHLEKLHDFSYLDSLKIVVGNLYTTTGINKEQLGNIDVVTGNFYSTDEEIIDYVKDILIVGGSIYNSKNGEEAVKVNIKR